MMKLDRIHNLRWYLRLIILGSFAIVLYVGFWFLLTKGTREETAQITDQVKQLQRQNAQAQIASQRLNNFKASYRARQEEYEELKALLPEQRELTKVLEGIQDRAKRNDLLFRKFSPKDDIQQDFYSGKPVEVGVSSTFPKLRAFFDDLAKYQRIVSVTDFKLSRIEDKDAAQNPGKSLHAQFLLTAYYVSPEKLKTATPAQKQQAPNQPAQKQQKD